MTELLDELEAGELSIRFEGEEPQVLLEWAIEEFESLAISAAFQADDVALVDMAYRLGSLLSAADAAQLAFAELGVSASVADGLKKMSAVALARLLLPDAAPQDAAPKPALDTAQVAS